MGRRYSPVCIYKEGEGMPRKEVKCYYCKELVLKSEVKIEIYQTKKTKQNRYFHHECYPKYLEAQKERREFDELYQYVKKEIMRYDDNQLLPNYFIHKLQALKVGDFIVKRNSKVTGVNKGYPFPIILMTFKFKKNDILNAISDRSKFKNEKGMIDYIMAIISNSINDVYLKLKEREQSNKRIENVEVTAVQQSDDIKFVNKNNIKQNKVADKLRHLF